MIPRAPHRALWVGLIMIIGVLRFLQKRASIDKTFSQKNYAIIVTIITNFAKQIFCDNRDNYEAIMAVSGLALRPWKSVPSKALCPLYDAIYHRMSHRRPLCFLYGPLSLPRSQPSFTGLYPLYSALSPL